MKVVVELPADAPTTEHSEPFLLGMVKRMLVSFCKYGSVAGAYPQKCNAIASLHQRLERYAETGNTEWLVDVANFAMIEFMHPRHEKAHYRATDSSESPGRTWHTGAVTAASNDNRESKQFYRRDGD